MTACLNSPEGNSRLLAASTAEDWQSALSQWRVSGLAIFAGTTHYCLCLEPLSRGYTLFNESTGTPLGPFRAGCIHTLGSTCLSNDVAALDQIAELKRAVQEDDFVSELEEGKLPVPLLEYLYEDGAFSKGSNSMGWSPYKIYRFLVDMAKKRGRGSMTQRQSSTLDSLIYSMVEPYLRDTHRVQRVAASSDEG